ncbi:hypothetical protein QR680_004336 [Steinernema hermaphroditum]|uniref:Uncharacterized protein n=1 Tax=Steinernema hermaphroditum TaxID=289476 RepID=A0AA39LT12_9BILA|nr:hypothetical protein QR680_004336 [Steinernema hermaphroditum]
MESVPFLFCETIAANMQDLSQMTNFFRKASTRHSRIWEAAFRERLDLYCYHKKTEKKTTELLDLANEFKHTKFNGIQPILRFLGRVRQIEGEFRELQKEGQQLMDKSRRK